MKSGSVSRAVRITTAAFLATHVPIAVSAEAAGPRPVRYTCGDGTTLQATFSPPGTSPGSVRLVYGGSLPETTLPQVISADGGRYAQGAVEFWIKGSGATLTRAGRATTCQAGR